KCRSPRTFWCQGDRHLFMLGLLVQEELRDVDVLTVGCGSNSKACWLIVWVALAIQPIGAVASFLLSQVENGAGSGIGSGRAVAYAVFEGNLSSGSLIGPLLGSRLRGVALGVASFFQVLHGLITQGLRSVEHTSELQSGS